MDPGCRRDTPQDILKKHSELMGYVRDEVEAGRRPRNFLPQEKGREIHDLIFDGRYDEARKLIDEALEKHRESKQPD